MTTIDTTRHSLKKLAENNVEMTTPHFAKNSSRRLKIMEPTTLPTRPALAELLWLPAATPQPGLLAPVRESRLRAPTTVTDTSNNEIEILEVNDGNDLSIYM